MVTGVCVRMSSISASGATMKSDELERAAAHFRTAGALPRLWFFTDPARTPTPWRVADALPPGAAVV